ERRAELAEAVRLGNYRSNALGVELGHRYTSNAVVSDGTPFPESSRDPDLYYEPTTHPGAYLPHAWIEHDRKQISTLDIVGRGQFTLIVGIGGEPWAQAAARVKTDLGVDLVVRFVGARCEYDDVLGEWAAARGFGDHGALLVRPDRHIAWRSKDLAPAPAEALRAAVQQVLSLDRGLGGVRPVTAPAERRPVG
ncbi:MAG TPA: 2,4-dichlorophenol 6-monooxygenase, partial [Caulobacteraceae bacterium]|nr:2,4-dichlorophenol 6-monooxygenase [Caulobacteraceae bacterium]